MNKPIPYGRQTIEKDDLLAVELALTSDNLTGGREVTLFEEELAAYVGAKYAVAVANGTAALQLAYLAAGLSKDDEVITSPLTFAATANAAFYANAFPRFADVQPETGNLEPESAQQLINKKTKIITPVHYAGQPCDMENFAALGQKNNLVIIEDACHALGAEYKGKRIGSCGYSDMAIFSFHPVKSITTGEGGAVTTNSRAYYDKLKLLRNHGIMTRGLTKDMTDLGYNYRITDIQCALGRSQLKKLSRFIKKRGEIAARYDALLATLNSYKLLSLKTERTHARHLYTVLIPSRESFIAHCIKGGLSPQIHYGLVSDHPYYRERGYDSADTPQAKKIAAEIVSLPIFPLLTDAEFTQVADLLRNYAAGVQNV